MPTKKSSPTKAKKSPAQSKSKSRSRSRTRSTSKSRKSTTRSRSRSASRRSVTIEVKQKSTPSPGRPPKSKAVTSDAVGSKSASVMQKEETIVPTRVSRRIIERTSYQVTKSSLSDKGDVLKSTTTTTTTTAAAAAVSKSGSEGGLGYAGMLMVVILLIVTYLIALSCSKTSCSVIKVPQCPATWKAYFNLEVTAVVLAFHVVMICLSLVPVGAMVQGQPLQDGHRLSYRCNAWFILLAVAAAFGYAITQTTYPIKMSYIHNHSLQFVTTHVILALVCSLILFIMGRNAPLTERSPASDGTFWNDFCMGRVLNPRIGSFDLKHHIFRLPLVIWLLMDLMYIADRFQRTKSVDPALATLVLMHTLYILFCLKNESTWFSSNDIMKEGAGFMYCWASLCFLPFVCTLQTRFLYLYPSEAVSNPYLLAALFLLNVVGLMFFIGSNWQKNEFRKNPYNPELAHLSSIPTATGKRLLCSGWWGIVRRPNYLGDLIMAFAWSLPCGISYGVPYTYPIYLAILLVGRVIADEKSCHQRYGAAWVKYTETVRYRLIPFVF